MYPQDFFAKLGTLDLATLEWDEVGEITLTHPDEQQVIIYRSPYGAQEEPAVLGCYTIGKGPNHNATSKSTEHWPILDRLFGGREKWQTWLEAYNAQTRSEVTAELNSETPWWEEISADGIGYSMEQAGDLDHSGTCANIYASERGGSTPVILLYTDTATGESHIVYTNPDTGRVCSSEDESDWRAMDTIFGSREAWQTHLNDHKEAHH